MTLAGRIARRRNAPVRGAGLIGHPVARAAAALAVGGAATAVMMRRRRAALSGAPRRGFFGR